MNFFELSKIFVAGRFRGRMHLSDRSKNILIDSNFKLKFRTRQMLWNPKIIFGTTVMPLVVSSGTNRAFKVK